MTKRIVVLAKPVEMWIFIYADDRAVECLRTVGDYAADPEMSFNWLDAAKVSREIREPREYPRF